MSAVEPMLARAGALDQRDPLAPFRASFAIPDARALARSMVDTGKRMGVPTVALLTDMNQVLATSAGNAVEEGGFAYVW